ncbi:MAG: hypothetical protein ACRC57_01485 [Sarcina sp.]
MNLIKNKGTGFIVKVDSLTNRAMTKNEIITECLTIGNFQIIIFVFSIFIISGIYFKNKNEHLLAFIDEKKERIKYFKESILFIFIPVLIAIIINFLIRTMMYFSFKGILAVTNGIEYSFAIVTYFHMIVLSIFAISVSLLFQVAIKSVFIATILPIVLFEGAILIFGVSNIFISQDIPILFGISNILSELIFKYINMFMSNYRVELLETQEFIKVILSYVASASVFTAIACRYIVTYDSKSLALKYRVAWIRRTMYIVITSIITIYLSIGILGSIALLTGHKLMIDKAYMLTTIISILIIPIIFIFIEYRYIKTNNIKKTKKVKKIKEKIENSNEAIEEQILETNLEDDNNSFDEMKIPALEKKLVNKGIMKETITTNYKENNIDKNENLKTKEIKEDFFI